MLWVCRVKVKHLEIGRPAAAGGKISSGVFTATARVRRPPRWAADGTSATASAAPAGICGGKVCPQLRPAASSIPIRALTRGFYVLNEKLRRRGGQKASVCPPFRSRVPNP